jgi:hypothetical protein
VKKTYIKPTIRSRAIRPGDIDAGSRFATKRTVPRYPIHAHAVIVEPIARTELSATTSDISVKGCFLESVDRLPANTVIQISIEQAAETFETWARVAHVQAGHGSGIAFFNTAAEQQLRIEKWVAKLRKSQGESH